MRQKFACFCVSYDFLVTHILVSIGNVTEDVITVPCWRRQTKCKAR